MSIVCCTVRKRSLPTRSILGLCLFLSASVQAQEVPEDLPVEPTEEAPAEPTEETPQVLEEDVAGPEKEDQETVQALTSALQEVRDLRYRAHRYSGIALLPTGLVVGLYLGAGELILLSSALGAGIFARADEFKDVREVDLEIKWLSRGLDGAVELGEIYLSDAARSAKRRRLISGGTLVAGSLLFYAVSVNEALGPASYNLGGLMVIGSAVLTLRTTSAERISQAYEQRTAEIEGSSPPSPAAP